MFRPYASSFFILNGVEPNLNRPPELYRIYFLGISTISVAFDNFPVNRLPRCGDLLRFSNTCYGKLKFKGTAR